MRKIPTLFVRDEQDRRYVTDAVTPGCEWVLAGEGVATRKYDGTCVMLDPFDRWWARREVKRGKARPDGFWALETDPATGNTVGWEPAEQSPFARWLQQALLEADAEHDDLEPGTYELIGQKINGDPERVGDTHALIRHADAYRINFTGDADGIRAVIRELHTDLGWEGVVWHHPDGRMAKLKARDLRPDGTP
jgi:hypothetical protein